MKDKEKMLPDGFHEMDMFEQIHYIRQSAQADTPFQKGVRSLLDTMDEVLSVTPEEKRPAIFLAFKQQVGKLAQMKADQIEEEIRALRDNK